MDDLRVLVFFYMVEGALVGFVGMGLLGIQLNRKQFFSVGVLQGLLVYLVRGIYAVNNIPFGTHTFFTMAGLIIILKLITKKGWGISSAAGFVGFVVILLGEGLMLLTVFNHVIMSFDKIMGNVWWHIAIGYCNNWLTFSIAIFLGLTKKSLIKVEELDGKV